MAIQLSTLLRNHILDACANGASGINFDSGVLRIYDGSEPDIDAAATGTVLAEIALPADAFAAASSGSVAASGTWEDTSANDTGTASHFRILQSGDSDGATGSSDERVGGTVTATGGGGDITLNSTSISATQQVTITSLSFSMPG